MSVLYICLFVYLTVCMYIYLYVCVFAYMSQGQGILVNRSSTMLCYIRDVPRGLSFGNVEFFEMLGYEEL